MTVVIIIVMCVVAVGVSISRFNALRARNRAEREEAKKRAAETSAVRRADENAPAPSMAASASPTFADYLDAENAPTLTRAQLDEWRHDFVLACKYGRRPRKGNAPFMRHLQEIGFALSYKPSISYAHAAKGNEKALPLPSPQKSLAALCKASYKAYIKSDEPAPVMR